MNAAIFMIKPKINYFITWIYQEATKG